MTFAALRELGTSYRFRTEVLGRGRQIGATWQGDIFLKGFGDPTLTAGGINRLAAQIGRLGITRISGRVLGDESWFDARRTAPGWKPDFSSATMMSLGGRGSPRRVAARGRG